LQDPTSISDPAGLIIRHSRHKFARRAVSKRDYALNLANAQSCLWLPSKIRNTDSNRHSPNLQKFALLIVRLAASRA
jgi:hypothetical protein